jgi:hypothetical protein
MESLRTSVANDSCATPADALDRFLVTQPCPLPLSVLIDAFHPVFLVVMGISLAVVAWRFAQHASVWNARLIVAGGLLLGFGYAVVLPLDESGLLTPLASSQGVTAETLAWHVVKLAVMNGGWLLLGTGMALHAKLWKATARTRTTTPAHPIPSHDPVT